MWDDKAALRKAIELRTELFGEDDVRVAEPLHALAQCEGIEVDACYDMMTKALEIQKQKLPEDHPDIAISLLSLAQHFHDDR